MNKFATIAILICAYLSLGSCASYGPAAGSYQRPVEIVAGAPYVGYPVAQPQPIPVDAGYKLAPIAAPTYGAKPAPAVRWTAQDVGSVLLYPGQNNYRTYASPPEYSKVVLPVVTAPNPVANVYLPQRAFAKPAPYAKPAAPASYVVESSRY